MITIPEPCKEDWEKMHVVDSERRHCASCEKTLTDFTKMSDDELVLFFRHNNKKLCGRFSSQQLNRPFNHLPESTRKSNWWKAAVLLPLSLFSKNIFGQQLDSVPPYEPMIIVDNDSIHKPDSLVAEQNLSPDTSVVQVDSTLVKPDSSQAEAPTAKTETITVMVGDINVNPIVLGWCPMPIQEVGEVMGVTSVPTYPHIEPRFIPNWYESTPFSWFYFRQRNKYETKLTAVDPMASAASEQNNPKEDPINPPVGESSWYDAILPSFIRKRKGKIR